MFDPSTFTLSLFHGTIAVTREIALELWVPMVSAIPRHGHQVDAITAPSMGNPLGILSKWDELACANKSILACVNKQVLERGLIGGIAHKQRSEK
jgi:hypothetical protein